MTASTRTIKRHALPASSMGNERTLTVIRYSAQNGGKKAYIQAGLHADEAPGFVVMHHLINLLDQLGADVTLLAEDSGVTPFDEACSRIWWQLAQKFPDRPIPSACLAATVELRGITDVSHEHGAQDAANIFLFLQRRGFIKGEAPELPPLRNEATPLRGVEHLKAPVPGVVVFLKEPGNRIRKGDVIAEIVNPLEDGVGNRITTVKSGIEGVLFSINTDRYARPGRILAKIAGKIPIKGKEENLLTL